VGRVTGGFPQGSEGSFAHRKKGTGGPGKTDRTNGRSGTSLVRILFLEYRFCQFLELEGKCMLCIAGEE